MEYIYIYIYIYFEIEVMEFKVYNVMKTIKIKKKKKKKKKYQDIASNMIALERHYNKFKVPENIVNYLLVQMRKYDLPFISLYWNEEKLSRSVMSITFSQYFYNKF